MPLVGIFIMAENFIQKFFQSSGRSRVWRIFVFILILIFISGLIDAGQYYNKGVDKLAGFTGEAIKLPKTKEVPFKLGLDLLGGSHLVYRADMSEVDSKDQASALEGVRDVIERRVNFFGVSEPLVQTSVSGGEYRVIVELAGIQDVNKAIDMIGETPLLEFKEEGQQERELSDAEKEKMEKYNSEARANAEEVLVKIKNGDDFIALAQEYNTDQEFRDNGGDLGWLSEADDQLVVGDVKDWEVGQTTNVITRESNAYIFYQLEDKRVKTNPFDNNKEEKDVNAAHILICYTESENCNSNLSRDEAYAKIKDIKAQATPANFSDLAKKFSMEPNAANSGGDLGWFGAGKMVKPFEDAVFSQEVGTISYIVETKFGFHIIYKKDERATYEYKVRRIAIPIATEADVIGDQKNWKNTELTGKNLARASVSFDPNDNSPEVSLEFDDEGGKMFADITERNIGKQVAIFLDDYAISVPTVNEKIPSGRAVISGKFNIKEAKLLAQRLNAGALPVPIELINQQTVGPSLGKVSLSDSLEAGLIGLLLVIIFMIFFYRLPGVLAVISLMAYGALVLAVFKIFSIVLTLAGMAGFILSIGMAVDANVLIFERLREELGADKPLGLAVDDSFNRAWPSIRDGNVSTLITCVILIWFSTSIVKGFAITLFLGVMISMFSAIVITKTLLQLIAGEWLEKRKWLIGVKR